MTKYRSYPQFIIMFILMLPINVASLILALLWLTVCRAGRLAAKLDISLESKERAYKVRRPDL